MPRRALLLSLLLAALGAAYLPALRAGYTNWDDADYVFANPALKGPAAAFAAPRLGHYHPLSDLSLAAVTRLAGESPFPQHAVNLLLHAANAVLLFLLLAALLGSDAAALAGAALWALHPANAEAAAWIAERKTLLCAFFYLAALLAYLRPPSARRTAAVAGLFLAALLSKASAVTLPLALPALDWLLRRRPDKRALAWNGLLLAAAAGFALLAAAAQGGQGRLLPAGGPGLFSFYAAKAVWPSGLCALYPYRETLAALAASPLLRLLPAAAFAAGLALAARKGRREETFGLLFFALNILPFALIVPVGPALTADRYLYLPLAGLALAAAAVFKTLYGSPRLRPAAIAAAAALALFFGTLTAGRAAVWRSSVTLWASVLKAYPASSVANLNMAHALLERGETAPALPFLLTAVRSDPGNPGALYDLGTLLARAGRAAEALPPLKEAVRLNPGYAPAWNNLGLAELELGRPAAARAAFLAAAAADPAYAPARANLAALEKPAPAR